MIGYKKPLEIQLVSKTNNAISQQQIYLIFYLPKPNKNLLFVYIQCCHCLPVNLNTGLFVYFVIYYNSCTICIQKPNYYILKSSRQTQSRYKMIPFITNSPRKITINELLYVQVMCVWKRKNR